MNGTYQTMDGFGFALTGGSAYHIHNLPSDKKQVGNMMGYFGVGSEGKK